MEQERRAIRVGLWVIALALVLRLAGSGALDKVVEFLTRQEVMSFLVYMETGRVVRNAPARPVQLSPAPTAPSAQPEQRLPSFGAEDAGLVEIYDQSNCDADIPTLLEQPLTWDLTGDGPTVLILHSHATESYTATQAEPYTPNGDFRTLDTAHNMVRVGARLQELLEERGIGVIHDTTLHDYPSYNDSYGNSRSAVRKWLEEYPSIQLVLDLHRDAVDGANQVPTATDLAGASRARVMLVVGTNGSGLDHPQWQENMSLAVKLHACLERSYPGFCRPISFRSQRFNQDLSTGALLVEIGSAGDTLGQALAAAELLADAITEISRGANTQAAVPVAAPGP